MQPTQRLYMYAIFSKAEDENNGIVFCHYTLEFSPFKTQLKRLREFRLTFCLGLTVSVCLKVSTHCKYAAYKKKTHLCPHKNNSQGTSFGRRKKSQLLVVLPMLRRDCLHSLNRVQKFLSPIQKQRVVFPGK